MAIVTIGNFDGVHIGHRALLARAREIAAGEEILAVTFDGHPASIVRGESPPVLTCARMRESLLMAAGASRLLTLPLTPELLSMEPSQFLKWLRERVSFAVIVEGGDFRFGRARSGDVETLRREGESMGFRTEVVPEATVALTDGHVVGVHSSVIRWLLQLGRVEDAARLLGRPHEVRGLVVEGQKRGASLGFPTANLETGSILLPADGVYAVRVRDGQGRGWRGAASVGMNPTFNGTRRTLEVHLLGMAAGADLYGQSLDVSFTKWIRDMLSFDSVERLIGQMRGDCEKVPA